MIVELRRTRTRSPEADMKLSMVLAVIFLVSTATASVTFKEGEIRDYEGNLIDVEGNDFKFY
jgi:hypothetical protein